MSAWACCVLINIADTSFNLIAFAGLFGGIAFHALVVGADFTGCTVAVSITLDGTGAARQFHISFGSGE